MGQAASKDAAPDGVAERIEHALKTAGISQYELAKRLAELRGTRLGSQDQAIRRIRKQGQTPTADVAHDLAKAFAPELELEPDYFVSSPATKVDHRQLAQQALEEVRQLREKVAALERRLGKEKPRAAARAASKTS